MSMNRRKEGEFLLNRHEDYMRKVIWTEGGGYKVIRLTKVEVVRRCLCFLI